MRLKELEITPQVGDIVEIELGDQVVETVIVEVTEDSIVAETDNTVAEGLLEAEYKGRKVKLNKPTRGDVKKFKVFVKNPKTGRVVKVNFGDPHMSIKKHIPARRKSFRARHNCSNAKDKTTARYWSCRKW